MIHLQIEAAVENSQAKYSKEFLRRAARETLKVAGVPPAGELTILVTDDEHLHQLNRQFRGVDAVTDVLSFSANEADPETGKNYLGDVLISYPRAAAQAGVAGHSLQDELTLLTIHGILHLLGYDHAEASQKDRMWTIQQAILNRLGCQISSLDHDDPAS